MRGSTGASIGGMVKRRYPLRRRGRPPHDDVLTPTEWRIVQLVRHGVSNSGIAALRRISRDAVKFHVRNALAKLGLRGRRELQHWTGIPRDSALYRRAEATRARTAVLSLGPVGQVSRTVRNIDAACAWYGGVLGLRHLFTFPKLAFFDLGGTRLYLAVVEGEPQPESTLYLTVDDIKAAYAELCGRGVNFENEPHVVRSYADGTEEWAAFFNDPEGRPLALIAWVKPNHVPTSREPRHAISFR
jgi:DNA-binding CsgD family transcriptional regulator/catechol 2,3-dioxygenase-like lactoylglutathione lyase family enzyme